MGQITMTLARAA